LAAAGFSASWIISNETSSVELARIATKRAHDASISLMQIMSCREFAAATNDTAA
jgi:hypothetical protein